MTWPPRWTEPHFKKPIAAKVTRGLKRETRTKKENVKKADVRTRDKYCRFPLCGCSRFQLALREVSHARHKGMGGNPAEDRSDPSRMVYLCAARHKANVFSVDRHTLRWRALTPFGANGAIAWDIALGDLFRVTSRLPKLSPMLAVVLELMPTSRGWFELARETAIHTYEPSTPEQVTILSWLRGMEH